METLLGLTNLSQLEFWICLVVIFLAGMVRGFSGFALSALVMAALCGHSATNRTYRRMLVS